ncbi:monovalent cation:proton antiporter-2 (CPA2) family protein [Pseudaestuariivita rosea]|uniref:monovalent cation:proton antiporter-2 (CPA2) family protein n=1 Tax=Pseudaestuariivita rosea TaxID=2763263 RepID=UPI001ABAEA0B|nr:monovalent cation:proton antiporter-2 (CPA2) family protein [Pseudaestuariivita rosea]
MEGFLLQATIYLGAAVVAVPIASRLGLGSVLGYLLAGIMIGPVLGWVGSETQDLQHFAEFGVVMMLFLIGLELDPRALWNMRDRLIGLGGLQIGLTTVLIMGACLTLGFDWQPALAIGLTFALSSTAIVLQTLSEKGLMQTNGGRSSFSVLLSQDIAVIPMLALLPLLATGADMHLAPDGSVDLGHSTDDHGHATMSLVEGLPGWGVTLVTLGVVATIIFAGIYLTRPLFRFIHLARLREMYTAFALLIVVGIAEAMILVGLSPALGAFLAGVVLANSEFRHELEADIEPFKGLLLGLFFITVGAGINFQVLFANPATIIALTLLLILIKGGVLFVIGRMFGLKGRDRWLFALSLAQAGEFGFVLLSFSVQQNVIDPMVSQQLLLIIALSMLITPLLFMFYEFLSGRMTDTGTQEQPADTIDEQSEIIIAGIGRFGQVVNRMVQMSGFKTTVLDNDLSTIELMRKFGFKGFFGDPSRPELLHAAGLAQAKVLVVAMDDPKACTRIVENARRERPDLHIIARARDRIHVYELYRAGADDIVRELFDSSLRAARYVLENMGLSEFEAADAETNFYKVDRHSLRELADVWKPGVPVADNPEYMELAHKLRKELETALVTELDEKKEQKEA